MSENCILDSYYSISPALFSMTLLFPKLCRHFGLIAIISITSRCLAVCILELLGGIISHESSQIPLKMLKCVINNLRYVMLRYVIIKSKLSSSKFASFPQYCYPRMNTGIWFEYPVGHFGVTAKKQENLVHRQVRKQTNSYIGTLTEQSSQ